MLWTEQRFLEQWLLGGEFSMLLLVVERALTRSIDDVSPSLLVCPLSDKRGDFGWQLFLSILLIFLKSSSTTLDTNHVNWGRFDEHFVLRFVWLNFGRSLLSLSHSLFELCWLWLPFRSFWTVFCMFAANFPSALFVFLLWVFFESFWLCWTTAFELMDPILLVTMNQQPCFWLADKSRNCRVLTNTPIAEIIRFSLAVADFQRSMMQISFNRTKVQAWIGFGDVNDAYLGSLLSPIQQILLSLNVQIPVHSP